MIRKCKVEYCNNEAEYNCDFCALHKTKIESKCALCGKVIFVKSKNYEPDKPFICSHCNGKFRAMMFNRSEKAKKVRSMNMKTYNSSELGKTNREKGLKQIHSRYKVTIPPKSK